MVQVWCLVGVVEGRFVGGNGAVEGVWIGCRCGAAKEFRHDVDECEYRKVWCGWMFERRKVWCGCGYDVGCGYPMKQFESQETPKWRDKEEMYKARQREMANIKSFFYFKRSFECECVRLILTARGEFWNHRSLFFFTTPLCTGRARALVYCSRYVNCRFHRPASEHSSFTSAPFCCKPAVLFSVGYERTPVEPCFVLFCLEERNFIVY